MTDQANAPGQLSGLDGKKAFIAGGTTGIGRAIAVLPASSGAEVFICGRIRLVRTQISPFFGAPCRLRAL
jgi:NAD(P)-dependent dehydrogenase (short-subunit alcohol dehydrogenase family)